MTPDSIRIKHAAKMIGDANALIIAAGAGMGVDSGLPDFRGSDGFWKAYPALAAANIDFYSIACPDAFHLNIRQAWGFYAHRLQLYRDTIPHVGFDILKCIGESKPDGYTIFTSNVDGQFQKAGFDEKLIYECHGSIHYLQCMEPCCNEIWPATFTPNIDMDTCTFLGALPRCEYCGGYARPNIKMFDDYDWISERCNHQNLQQKKWLSSAEKPVIIEIGAGTDIETVRHFTHEISRFDSGHIIRINPTDCKTRSNGDIGLASGALESLEAIAHELDL